MDNKWGRVQTFVPSEFHSSLPGIRNANHDGEVPFNFAAAGMEDEVIPQAGHSIHTSMQFTKPLKAV